MSELSMPECPICLENYDLHTRQPFTLTACGHSLCLEDLKMLPTQACPMCKTSIKGKVKNFALMQVIEAQAKSPSAGPKCRVHVGVPFEFWCEQCSTLCCPKCFLTSHKGHTMHGLEEAMEQNKSRIDEVFSTGTAALNQAEMRLQTCRDRKLLATANATALRSSIDTHFDMLLNVVQDRHLELINMVEEMSHLALSQQEMEEKVRQECHEAVSSQLMEAKAMRDRCDMRLLSEVPIMVEGFKAFLQTGDMEDAPGTAWKMHFEDPGPLLSAIRSLGAVVAAPITGDRSVAAGEGLQRAVMGQTATFVITSYDASGSRRFMGGEQFLVSFSSSCETEHRLTDRNDGTYEVTYKVLANSATEAGRESYFDLEVRRNSDCQPLLGSPWRVLLMPAFQGIHTGTIGNRGTGPLQFQGPAGIAVDSERIYVADGDNHRIQVLDAVTGSPVAQYGRPDQDLKTTYGVAVDETSIYVAERDYHRVSVLDKSTGNIRRLIGEGSGLKEPLAVAIFNNLLAVSDTVKHRVMLFEKSTGKLLRMIGPAISTSSSSTSPRGPAQMASTCDVAFDSAGFLYVTDREASRILVFQPTTGNLVRQIGSHGTGPGQFNHVNRVFVTEDRIYATDRYGSRCLVFDKATGNFITAFGSGFIERPNGVAVVRSGRVVVGDFAKNCLHVFV